MKTKNIFYLLAFVVATFSISSCAEFLEELPDNRTELDTEDKILSTLVSAYPENAYILCCEYSSDNLDEMSFLANPDFLPLMEQVYNWQDVTEQDNEAPSQVWGACYLAIASANQALLAVENMGGPITTKLKAAKGEALVARAYSHFLLVNMFCQSYNPAYSGSDLGIAYMEEAETDLDPKYDRGTVAEVYEKIEKDLIEGLPLIDESVYSVPKYHFNVKAAYAFAARFYLFYQKWDQAIEAATTVLGSTPQSMTRDMAYMSTLGVQSADGKTLLKTMEYINASRKCNLLMQTGFSELGVVFAPFTVYTGFAHGSLLNDTETFGATPTPWSGDNATNWYVPPYKNETPKLNKLTMWRLPYLFEYTDPVNLIGYAHIVYPAFTIEETLLIRAEAHIMKKEYGPALTDMNLWVKVYVKSGTQALTTASVDKWANALSEYRPLAPSIKKKIEAPAFAVAEGTQMNMCYALLHMRRLETLHMGLRWFDVKRYGITIYRRKLAAYRAVSSISGTLKPRDLRCAMQLPADVISAGMTPNPR